MCSNIPYVDPQVQFDNAVMSNVLSALSGLGLWDNCIPGQVSPEWKALAKTWCGNVEAVAAGFGPTWTSPKKGYDVTQEILMVLNEILEE